MQSTLQGRVVPRSFSTKRKSSDGAKAVTLIPVDEKSRLCPPCERAHLRYNVLNAGG